MNTNKLPKDLIEIGEAIIEHIHKGSNIPNNIEELENWFEIDGWDLLIGDTGLVGYAVNLLHISSYKFDDSEVRYEYEIQMSTKITDVMRIEYGRLLIQRAIEFNEGDVCPSVHCINLSNGDKSAVIGCLVEIHGQGGPVIFWQGTYKTQEEFLKAIRINHIVMFDELKNIGDQEILNLWQRK